MFSVNPMSYDAVKTATMLSAVDPIRARGRGPDRGDLPRRGPTGRGVAADRLPGPAGQPQGQRGDQAAGARGRQALGYVPSETGRALSSGRTRRIGLLLTDLENQFYPHVIAPIHHELEAFGYQLVLQTETSDTATVAERLISNGLDGVLLATTTVDSVVPMRLRDRGVPFVYFNRTADAVEADSATVDPVPGMSEVGRARSPSWATDGSAPSSARATPAPRCSGRPRCGRRWTSTA